MANETQLAAAFTVGAMNMILFSLGVIVILLKKEKSFSDCILAMAGAITVFLIAFLMMGSGA
jgi:predicted signal transduction protein with EAL and GGDEF domain